MENCKAIILASNSPRRADILRTLNIPFRIVPSDFDEESVQIEDPKELVKVLAYHKAKTVLKQHKGCLVIGADTVVAVDGHILGKPSNKDEAIHDISLLQGRTHKVYSGIALITNKHEYITYDETEVYMNKLTRDEILAYVSTKDPYDKAGSYGIQSIGASLVKKINGDFYNVMGLPVSKLIEGFKSHNLDYFNTFLK